jgi:hypothetical protein
MMRFLNNTEDMGKLSTIVEDIRDAMMEYQVRHQVFLLQCWLMYAPDIVATRHIWEESYAHCKSYSLIPPSHVV